MAEHTRDIVVVGTSAGGVPALQRLVAALPLGLPASVFIVQHTWPEGRSFLPAILARAGPLRTIEARDGEPIERGTIYVAPPDQHLMIETGRIVVVHGPRENRARPAINPLFRSAAEAYGHRVIGVILTGMLDDGAAGLWAIKQCGGVAIVQSDAEFDQMPRAASEAVPVDFHVPLAQIAPLISRLVRETVPEPARAGVPAVTRMNDKGAKMKSKTINLDDIGQRSVFSCPECNGALWEIEEGVLQYRCHVGHIYSADSLKQAQNGNIEQTLWTALRALKESAALDERLAARAAEHQLDHAVKRYRESASAKAGHITHLQNFLAALQFEPAGEPRLGDPK
jgi:two-component system, chemotaxis family, protein-glutamate methylesterase/glutaminase